MWLHDGFTPIIWSPLTSGPLRLANGFDCPTMQQGQPCSQFQCSQQLGVKEGLAHSFPLSSHTVCRWACAFVQLHKPTTRMNRFVSKIFRVKFVALNRSFSCVHRYDDSEDEMEPEIEEAFENFWLESERKRQQWHESENLWDSNRHIWKVEKQRNECQIGSNIYFTENKRFNIKSCL